jgi:hypothetical protein
MFAGVPRAALRAGAFAGAQGRERQGCAGKGRAGKSWARVLLPLLAAVLALQAPRDVFAAEERMRWDAPLGCPGLEAVRAAVSAIAGSRKIELGRRSVRGRVERAGAKWRLLLELEDGLRRRSRILTAPRCEDLVQAAGVAIVLAFDTSAEAGKLDEPGEPEVTEGGTATAEEAELAQRDSGTERPPPAPVETPAPLPPLAPEAPSSSPPTEIPVSAGALQLGANALVDGAALRRAALGVELSFGWRWGALELAAYGAWLPPQRYVQGSRGTADFALLSGGIRAGYALAVGVVDLAGYISLELGRLSARGVDLIDARTFHDLWVAPSAGVQLEKRIAAGWSLVARAGALLPLTREGYDINADERIHRPAALGVRGSAGVGLAW